MAKTQKGVLCAECEHLNPPGSESCEECEANLYKKCRHCGELNQKVLSTCRSCNRSLHRRPTRKRSFSRRSRSRRRAVTVGILVLVLGGILLMSRIDWFW